MNQNHPPRVRAALERIQLIKTDLSGVNMSVSLDGPVGSLPETTEILSSINSEDKTRLLTALNDAFEKRDLTKVSALYSYAVLFQEADKLEIKAETLQNFQVYLRGHKDFDEMNAIFTHPGFSNLVLALNNKDLTDLQFRLFARYHLENKTTIGKKIAGIQKNFPLTREQWAEVVNYLEEIKLEKEKVEKKKNHTRTIILVVLIITLFIIRMALRMHR